MFDHILSILFPEHCRGCGKSGTALCATCAHRIRPALSLPEDTEGFALFDYGDPVVQKAIWELKYHRKSPVAKALALHGGSAIREYVDALLKNKPSMPVVLVPVPQHYTKTFSRGFNQSLLIAKWLKNGLPKATIRPLLKKIRSTSAQAKAHDRKQRMKNLSQSMRVEGVLDNALYVIVDDVITTGSTIQEAGRALRTAGAKHICAISLAHGYRLPLTPSWS